MNTIYFPSIEKEMMSSSSSSRFDDAMIDMRPSEISSKDQSNKFDLNIQSDKPTSTCIATSTPSSKSTNTSNPNKGTNRLRKSSRRRTLAPIYVRANQSTGSLGSSSSLSSNSGSSTSCKEPDNLGKVKSSCDRIDKNNDQFHGGGDQIMNTSSKKEGICQNSNKIVLNSDANDHNLATSNVGNKENVSPYIGEDKTPVRQFILPSNNNSFSMSSISNHGNAEYHEPPAPQIPIHSSRSQTEHANIGTDNNTNDVVKAKSYTKLHEEKNIATNEMFSTDNIAIEAKTPSPFTKSASPQLDNLCNDVSSKIQIYDGSDMDSSIGLRRSTRIKNRKRRQTGFYPQTPTSCTSAAAATTSPTSPSTPTPPSSSSSYSLSTTSSLPTRRTPSRRAKEKTKSRLKLKRSVEAETGTNTKISGKKKRRRRSSLSLHAGGLISLNDIEKIGDEAVKRKRKRDVDQNTAKVDDKEMESTETPTVSKCPALLLGDMAEQKSHQRFIKVNECGSKERGSIEVPMVTKDSMLPFGDIAEQKSHLTSLTKNENDCKEKESIETSMVKKECLSSLEDVVVQKCNLTAITNENHCREREATVASTVNNDCLLPFEDVGKQKSNLTSIIKNENDCREREAMVTSTKNKDSFLPLEDNLDQKSHLKAMTTNENHCREMESIETSMVTKDSLLPLEDIVNQKSHRLSTTTSNENHCQEREPIETPMVDKNSLLPLGDIAEQKSHQMSTKLNEIGCNLLGNKANIKPHSSTKTAILHNQNDLDKIYNVENSSEINIGGKESCHHRFIPDVQEITDTMIELFHDKMILTKPCMSARIFACIILLIKSRNQSTKLIETSIPLLRAFVNLELSYLMDTEVKDNISRKRVNFCSTDNSSMITPVDTEKGSESVIENCIFSLQKILKQIENLPARIKGENIPIIISTLQEIVATSTNPLLIACSKAMPEARFDWPLSRLVAASKYYINELYLVQSSSYKEIKQLSKIRHSLGDLIGRTIRFYLRQFFNPVPVSLHTYSDAEQPDYDFSRSSVHKIIEMGDAIGERDTAVADGSISSVVSLALHRIDDFFELTSCINSTCNNEEKYIKSFCCRPASKIGLIKRGSTIVLNENDINEILLDISESHITLAGIRACKFLHTLMKWPGVLKAINDVGGWSKVEQFARIFSEFELEKEVPDEKHFKLLISVEGLIQRIDIDYDELLIVEEECDNSLRLLWKRFRCGTRNKDLLRINPGIKVIKQHLKAGGDTYFPTIVNLED